MSIVFVLTSKLNRPSINEKFKIGIIGLGYVGLPLAIEFGNILML